MVPSNSWEVLSSLNSHKRQWALRAHNISLEQLNIWLTEQLKDGINFPLLSISTGFESIPLFVNAHMSHYQPPRILLHESMDYFVAIVVI